MNREKREHKQVDPKIAATAVFLRECRESGNCTTHSILSSAPIELLHSLTEPSTANDMVTIYMVMGIRSLEFPSDPALDEDQIDDGCGALVGAASLEKLKRCGLISFRHVSIFEDTPIQVTMLEMPSGPQTSH